MKVHAVTLLIVDVDNLGAAGIKTVLENQRYPNHCISPTVMATVTKDVEWSDDHPLNANRTLRVAFEELFGKTEH